MNFAKIQDILTGKWIGNNLLRLPWLTPPDYLSTSHLSVAHAARRKFLTFTYTWDHESTAQEGLLVVGYDQKQDVATAAWVDSWHMSSKVMFCRGSISERGIIDLRGSYEAPPGPDWGWRIVVSSPSDNALQIIMYNCTPEGIEELAVQAEYRRSSP